MAGRVPINRAGHTVAYSPARPRHLARAWIAIIGILAAIGAAVIALILRLR